VDVFISHAASDREIGKRLGDKLKQAGESVWQEDEAIKFGEDWTEEIVSAISEAQNILITLSKKRED
jgi:hypothetical protein